MNLNLKYKYFLIKIFKFMCVCVCVQDPNLEVWGRRSVGSQGWPTLGPLYTRLGAVLIHVQLSPQFGPPLSTFVGPTLSHVK